MGEGGGCYLPRGARGVGLPEDSRPKRRELGFSSREFVRVLMERSEARSSSRVRRRSPCMGPSGPMLAMEVLSWSRVLRRSPGMALNWGSSRISRADCATDSISLRVLRASAMVLADSSAAVVNLVRVSSSGSCWNFSRMAESLASSCAKPEETVGTVVSSPMVPSSAGGESS